MESLGELFLNELRFPVSKATFRFISDAGQGTPGWDFDIRTGPATNEVIDENVGPLWESVRLFAEGDPIPLQNQEDLTGAEVYMEEPFDPDSGEPCFTLYASEHGDISKTRLTFLERKGDQYRIRITALAHGLFPQPATLSLETWITRLPAGSYGSSN